MDKEEVVKKLKEHGFMDVNLESGVVLVTVSSEAESKKVTNIIKEIKYNASWGVKIRSTSACN